MTSPTPDISQLSLSPSAKTREYDSFNDAKTFHYSTSPPLHSNISPQFYNTQASLGPQSVKKPARAGLPTVRFKSRLMHLKCLHLILSNGMTTPNLVISTTAHYLHPILATFPRVAGLLRWPLPNYTQINLNPQPGKMKMT